MKDKFAYFTIITAVSAAAGIVVTLFLISTDPITIAVGPKSIPVLQDDTLAIELVAEGLDSPTSMSFLDDGSILVLEKNSGQVRIVSDGEILNDPAIAIEVAKGAEQGLLGITTWKEVNDTSVFLFLTEKYENDTRNHLYKYLYDKNKRTLENKTLLLDLPGEPGPFHNGGKISIGPR
ncbi:MAG TPA: PQQ-dependent sugar dehydrogenase, partial [Nitrososphaeraceae archaeon]|nr:PQQ-dependent sugar dehydrogenase [Nitrososphaeraceae archaeon]